MAVETRELYSSPNGDRWFLGRDAATGEVFVRHEPDPPSGGRRSHIEQGARNPEHQALLRLIGTLIEVNSADRHEDARQSASMDETRARHSILATADVSSH